MLRKPDKPGIWHAWRPDGAESDVKVTIENGRAWATLLWYGRKPKATVEFAAYFGGWTMWEFLHP